MKMIGMTILSQSVSHETFCVDEFLLYALQKCKHFILESQWNSNGNWSEKGYYSVDYCYHFFSSSLLMVQHLL
jgi:hypothetical protein